MISIARAGEKGLIENHLRYGEDFKLIKHVPSATGGIYRQNKKIYEDAPYILRGSIARTPTPELISEIGESSTRFAQITIPVKFVEDLFGRSTKLLETITTKDLIIFDQRVWRITQAALTGRLTNKPLLFSLELREKLGEKEEEYL